MSPDVVVHLPSGAVAASRSLRANRYHLGGVELRCCGVDYDGSELARLPCGRTARVTPYVHGALDIQRAHRAQPGGEHEQRGHEHQKHQGEQKRAGHGRKVAPTRRGRQSP